MIKVVLKKGYSAEMNFIFEDMQSVCEFLSVALNKAEEGITATVKITNGKEDEE